MRRCSRDGKEVRNFFEHINTNTNNEALRGDD